MSTEWEEGRKKNSRGEGCEREGGREERKGRTQPWEPVLGPCSRPGSCSPRRWCCFVFTWPSASPCGPQTDVNDVSRSSSCSESSALLMSCGETSGEDGRHRKKATKTVSKVQRRNENTGRNDPGEESRGRVAWLIQRITVRVLAKINFMVNPAICKDDPQINS